MTLRHLGAHLILSVVIVIPLPGVRSLVRFLWTAAYWAKVQWDRLRGRPGDGATVHAPLVMLLSLLPGSGLLPTWRPRRCAGGPCRVSWPIK